MTPEQLRALGADLFGPHWQAFIARLLDVSDRTVRRWAAGSSPVPAGLRDEIAGALEALAEKARG